MPTVSKLPSSKPPVHDKKSTIFLHTDIIWRVLSFLPHELVRNGSYEKVSKHWHTPVLQYSQFLQWFHKGIINHNNSTGIQNHHNNISDNESQNLNSSSTGSNQVNVTVVEPKVVTLSDLPSSVFELSLGTLSALNSPGLYRVDFRFVPYSLIMYKSVLQIAALLESDERSSLRKQQRERQVQQSYFRLEETWTLSEEWEEHNDMPVIDGEQDSVPLTQQAIPQTLKALYPVFATEPQQKKKGEELPSWILVMILHGGNFAAGVFKGSTGECLVHKSFHAYVTRKKQGKRQASHDKKSHAQSGGAWLRRQNEEHFKEKVRELVSNWNEPYLSKCVALFIHCPGPVNKQILFYENSPLDPNDKRIKSIACDTGPQANFTQVELAYRKLTTVTVLKRK